MFQEPKSLSTYLVQTTIVLWTQTVFDFARILNVMSKEACCPDAVSYNSVPRPINARDVCVGGWFQRHFVVLNHVGSKKMSTNLEEQWFAHKLKDT